MRNSNSICNTFADQEENIMNTLVLKFKHKFTGKKYGVMNTDATQLSDVPLSSNTPDVPVLMVKTGMLLLVLGCVLLLATGSQFAVAQTPPPLPGKPEIFYEDFPAQVLIGEEFTFKVTFKNPGDGSAPQFGYNTFIDLIFPVGGANVNKPQPLCGCDGIEFMSARLVDVNAPVVLKHYPDQLPAPPCPPILNFQDHPFASSGFPTVVFPDGAGGQLITVVIPFGSYDVSQPKIVIEVTAKVSINADINVPLNIYARGGYRFGADANDNNNPPDDATYYLSDFLDLNAKATTTPTVLIIRKKYLGPENENATGSNFINTLFLGYPDGYPLQFELTIDVANGQMVTDVELEDCLPPNMAYYSLVEATPIPLPVPPLPIAGEPGTCLYVNWNSLTGAPGADATVKFEFFIPEKDEEDNLVLPDCAPVESDNEVKVAYKWDPIDHCDTENEGDLIDGESTDSYTILDKSIAIQKYYKIIPSTPESLPHPIPGDFVEYTLYFQLSDYKTVENLIIEDILSDGQQLSLTHGPPTLTVIDKFDPPQCGPTPFIYGKDWYTDDSTTNTCADSVGGAKRHTFLVSEKMKNACPIHPRHGQGIMTGGAAGLPLSTVPASGQIVFYAEIMDRFEKPHAGDPWVDKDDPMKNCATIEGSILENRDDPDMPDVSECQATDTSWTEFSIASDNITKTVYSVRRKVAGIMKEIWGPSTTTQPSIPQVAPGDEVTFRIEKTIPSSDAEDLTIQDWPPLPILDVMNPRGNSSQETWSSFNPAVPCTTTPPASGDACYLPTDEFTPWAALNAIPPWRPAPSLTADPATNSLMFDYHTYLNDDKNKPRKIDLLFTLTVKNDPFADGLFLTNEAQECEENSFGERFCNTAIAQMQLQEPNVRISKGIVATDNDRGKISPPVGLITFEQPGQPCPRFNGTISSDYLESNPLNGDISMVDANDRVTFAIVVENLGTAPNGAFDVVFHDTWPADTTCFAPDKLSVCVYYGNGTQVDPTTGYTITWGSGAFTIELIDPVSPQPHGALGPYSATGGNNIVIVTFDATIPSDIRPGCCENLDTLDNYSNTEDGDDFVEAGFGGPFADGAQICVKPSVTKTIVTSSEDHTLNTPTINTPLNPEQLTIGEIVQYRIEVTVPETKTPLHYELQDFLPNELMFLNDGTAKVALVSHLQPGQGLTSTVPGLAAVLGDESGLVSIIPSIPLQPSNIALGSPVLCGFDPIFDLGLVTNLDVDLNQEFIVLEFNALVCNSTTSNNNVILTNTIGVIVDGTQESTSSVNVKVVEPNLTIEKTVSPISVILGETVTYTVTITNNSGVDAFDVSFRDFLPAGLYFNPSSLYVGSLFEPNTGSPSVDRTVLSANSSITITYDAQTFPSDCPVVLTNNAKTYWTSLPGLKGTYPNPTESQVPDDPGQPNGERAFNGDPVNDYIAYDTASVVVVCPDCATPPANMVAWWPLDEQNGETSVEDIVGYDNFGTPRPNIQLGTGSPIPVPGKVGGALRFFDKFHVEVPQQSAELSFDIGDFSIDAWIKPDTCQPDAYSPIVEKYDPVTNTGFSFYLVRNPNNLGWAKLYLNINGIVFESNLPGYWNQFSTWTHVGVTVQRTISGSGAVNFYIDGPLTPGFPPGPIPSTSVSTTATLLIGETRLGNLLKGKHRCPIEIDELELFNRALDSTEVQAIWAANLKGKCKYDLEITKTALGEPWTVGNQGSFTIQVKNVGDATIPAGTVITVTDVLQQPCLTFSSVTLNGWQQSSSDVYTFIVPAPGLAVQGELPLLTITANVVCPGPIRNCARVTAEINGVIMQEPMENNVDCVTIRTNWCYPPPSCMFNWWTFDEATGGIVNDIRGQNNAGTWIGNPDPVQGKVAAASKFNGGSYISIPDHPELNFGTSDFSIDAWIQTEDEWSLQVVLDKRTGATSNPRGYLLYIDQGRPGIQLADGTHYNYTSSGFVADGNWHLLAVTVDRDSPSGLRFYVDGALTDIMDPTVHIGSLSNTAPLAIGQTFRGALDELETFCCVLNETDILGIWAADSIGKCKTITGIIGYPEAPNDFELYQSYPNPFNSTTTIEYHVPVSVKVTLSVYDKLGREVAVLVNQEVLPGRHRVSFEAGDLLSGMYFYRIHAGEYHATRKFILMK